MLKEIVGKLKRHQRYQEGIVGKKEIPVGLNVPVDSAALSLDVVELEADLPSLVRLSKFSPNENKFFALYIRGLDIPGIAEQMGIKEGYARVLKREVLGKLELGRWRARL